jgi:hypothetical protein
MARSKPKQRRRADVPHCDHVARHCNPQRVIRHPVTKAIEGVFPQAFELRVQKAEQYLSTHWVECFSAEVDAQFRGVVQALRAKRDVVPNSAIARLNAGSVIIAGQARGHPIRIRDRSSADDPGYSGIYGTPRDNSDAEFLALLASECCVQVRGVREIDETGNPG